MPSLAATAGSVSDSPVCTACSIQRAAVSASAREESICDSPGAISGRHFMHGRKAAASACARVSKKRQFSRRGVRTRQTGRQ